VLSNWPCLAFLILPATLLWGGVSMVRARKWVLAVTLFAVALVIGFVVIVLATNPWDNWP